MRYAVLEHAFNDVYGDNSPYLGVEFDRLVGCIASPDYCDGAAALRESEMKSAPAELLAQYKAQLDAATQAVREGEYSYFADIVPDGFKH